MNWTRDLVLASSLLCGRHYGPRMRDGQVNCSTFAESFLEGRYPRADIGAEHEALMIMGSDPWSPVHAVERLGIGRMVEAPQPGRLHLVQGWTGLEGGRIVKRSRGHTLLWGETLGPLADPRGLVMEANVSLPWVYR